MGSLDDEADLYKVLGVDKSASQAEIKKAYHRLALQLHPDKNKDDEEATQKFQSLKQIYAVLGDPDKRKRYDQTGSLEDAEELSSQSFEDLFSFYRDLYKQVTPQDIEDYAATYRGSAEETADLVQLYERHKGDMRKVFQWQVCSDAALDSHRFCAALRQHCQETGVEEHPAFTKWAKGVDKRPAPKDPLKPRCSSTEASGSHQALVAAIRNNGQSKHSDIVAEIEARYCQPSPGKRKRGKQSQPAEEAEQEVPAQTSKKAGRKGKKKAAAG